MVYCAFCIGGMLPAQVLVQGVVVGLNDATTAKEARMVLEEQPGVIMARFDVPTKNMMLHVSPTCGIDQAALNVLLTPLGLSVRCFARRDARELPFRHLDAERCGASPMHER